MKKVLFTLIVTAGIAVSCNNKSASLATVTDSTATSKADSKTTSKVKKTEGAAAITFAEIDYEFGKIKEGDIVTHEFKFTNTGTEPLIISNATASCGCTIPEYPKEPIAPGKGGVIKVVFNSANKSGMQQKVISITSNANPELSEIYITGEVAAK